MKKNVLILVALAAGLQTQAQLSLLKKKVLPGEGRAFVHSLISRQGNAGVAHKPTAIKQRVIAQAFTYIEDGAFTDSFTYRYASPYGSRFDYNNIGYQQSFSTTYAPEYIDHRYGNDPMDMLADTIAYYEDGTLAYREHAYSRTDRKIDSFYSYEELGNGSFGLYSRNLITYNASNVKIRSFRMELTESTGVFDTISSNFYTYNNDFSRILFDTAFAGPPGSPSGTGLFAANRYTYNAAGKIDTVTTVVEASGTQYGDRTILDYYSDGKIRRAWYQTLTGGNWQTGGYDTLGYTAGVDYVTYWRQGEGPTGSYLTRQFPGANGNPDSTVNYEWDNANDEWVIQEILRYEYNSYDNPVRVRDFAQEGGTETEIAFANFYYEEYDDAVLAINPLNTSGDFRVYPNPFDRELSIDWKGRQAADVNVRLVNILGQEVYRGRLKLSPGNNHISLPQMSKGNYVLLLQDAQGQTWSRKMVKK